MPIKRIQFELGINADIQTWMKKIYNFLSEHSDEAFSEEELANALDVLFDINVLIKPGGSIAKYNDAQEKKTIFKDALEKLVAIDAVESREIRNIVYFGKGKRSLEEIL